MDGTKHPLKSLGIVGPLAALLVLIFNRIWPGLGITDADAASAIDLIDGVLGLVTGIVGRARATQQIAKLIPVLLILLALQACAGGARLDAMQALDASCISYRQGLDLLADLRARGRLDAKAIATVDKVVLVVSPICTAAKPPVDIDSALAVVVAELAALQPLILK